MNIFVRFPEGRDRALTFSYDDGVIQDKRMVELLDRHGMKGTFNLNSGCFRAEDDTKSRRMTEREIVELFGNGDHEVACHGVTHPYLETLPTAEAVCEVLEDRRNLERLFGKPIRGMAYPFGTYNERVINVLRDCGIVYSRTVSSTEKFELPSDWFRLPATCHHNNPRLMELAKTFVEKDLRDRNAKLFYLWGHTYEFADNDNWNVIEEFMDYMAGRDDSIWYATNMEIYDYLRDYSQLIFSVGCDIVENPTARRLWFCRNGKTYSVGAGETLKLK